MSDVNDKRSWWENVAKGIGEAIPNVITGALNALVKLADTSFNADVDLVFISNNDFKY